jgi:hypothetical protein
MKLAVNLIEKQIAFCLAVLLALPCRESFAAPPQQAQSAQQPQSAGTDSTLAEAGLPDAPTPVSSQSNGQSGQSGSARSRPAQSGPEQSGPAQPGTDQQQNGGSKPLGTAAAPYEKPEGVAASRPAGAVIAPAKQRRVRAIFISIGVVVGAGVAIGTVAALSHSSPSHP